MTRLVNNFEGGPDGTDISVANSNQTNTQNAFDSVSVNSGTLQYQKRLDRPTAEYVMHASTGGSANEEAVTWSTSMGAKSNIWFRVYVYYDVGTVWPGSLVIFRALSGATPCFWVGVGSGSLFITDGSTANGVYSALPVQLGTWFRIECRVQFSATVGNADLMYFTDADSDTPADIVSCTNYNLGAPTADTFRFGYAFAASTLPNVYMSGLELNDIDYPGPAPFRAGKGVPGILTNPIAIHMA